MNGQRISESLCVDDERICCSRCGQPFAPAGKPWKEYASLTTLPVAALPGAGSGVDAQVVLRRFACPGCGSLLDTETALPGDPFLDDIVQV